MGINIAAMKAEQKRLAATPGQGGGLEMFVMMPEGNGSTTVRLLPPQEGRDVPHVGTRVHTINERKVHCRKEDTGTKYVGNCPICDYYNLLWKEADALDKKGKIEEAERKKAEARMIKPVERYYYNAIVRVEKDKNTGNETKNVGPKILSIGKTLHLRVFRAICGDESLDEPGIGDVTDLKKGRDFKIMKRMTSSGKDSYPNYDDSKFLDISPAGAPDLQQKWMGELHDLTALRKVKSVEDCEKELAIHMRLDDDAPSGFDRKSFEAKYGGKKLSSVSRNTGEEEDEENEEAAPSIRDRIANKVKAPVAKTEEVEDEDDEDEDETPPPPPKKAKKAPKPPVEEDDDDDEVADEDKPIDPAAFLKEIQSM